MTLPSRLQIALVAFAAWFTLILQTYVDLAADTPLGEALWVQARFFTNLTVLLVALIYGLAALGRAPSQSLFGGLTVWAAMTGLVYHLLLAADHTPEGLDVVVNVFQHTLVPLGVVWCWLFLVPKDQLTWRDPAVWAGYPLAYAGYGLARGLAGDAFPYFFLNPEKSGWGGVALYALGLSVVFTLAGLVFVGIARCAARRHR